jgi:hypothetical protein
MEVKKKEKGREKKGNENSVKLLLSERILSQGAGVGWE